MTRTSKKASTWLACLAAILLPVHVATAAPKKKKKPADTTTSAPTKTTKAGGAAGAKKHLTAGRKAFRAKKFDVAARELDAAYKASPQPATLRMLADSYLELKDFTGAHDAYQLLLDEHDDKLSDDERGEVEGALKQIEKSTAQLEIIVDETGAGITVDGRTVGRSPLSTPVRVAPGTHMIRATSTQFDPIEQDVDVKAGDKKPVELKFGGTPSSGALAASSGGKVKITASPSEATIDIDDNEMGTGTYEGEVSPGKHTIAVRAPGYQTKTEEVTVGKGKTVSREVTLEAGSDEGEPAKEAKPSTGFVSHLYGGVGVFGVVPLAGPQQLPCPEGGNCTKSMQLGGGLGGHVGYKFGPLGIELGAAFLGERRNEKQAIPGTDDIDDPRYAQGDIARFENFAIYSTGLFVGLGPRYTTSGNIAFSAGADLGLAFRSHTLKREVGGAVLDSYQASASTTGFAMQVDAGVLFKLSSSMKLGVGLLALVDFSTPVRMASGDPRQVEFEFVDPDRPDDPPRQVNTVVPTPAYVVSNGAQIFLGPQVALHFN